MVDNFFSENLPKNKTQAPSYPALLNLVKNVTFVWLKDKVIFIPFFIKNVFKI